MTSVRVVASLLLPAFQLVMSHLNFITLSQRFQIGTSYVPAFEVGVERYSRLYPALFANYTYTRIYIREFGVGSCAADGQRNVINQLAELYSSGELQKPNTILIVPIPCIVPTVPAADFGRELDVLMLDCAPADVALANRQRFPTVVSFSYADVTAYGAATVEVLRRFSWKNVALISDLGSNTKFRGSSKVAQICAGVLDALNKILPEINFLVITTEDTRNKWTLALSQAQNYSRIVIVCTYPYNLRDLLMTAVELDMAHGDYIFFSIFTMRMPRESSMVWEKGDKLDEIIRPMVPNFFVVSSPTVDWPQISNLTKTIVARRKVWITRPPEELPILADPELEFNEISTTCFEMAEMMSKVFYSASQKSGVNGSHLSDSLTSGKNLAQLFYNQTIMGEGVGKDISISSSGMRRFQVEIQQYNFSWKRFEPVLLFDTETRMLHPLPGVEVTWKSGHIPADRPRCLNEEDCVLEQDIQRRNQIAWGTSATVVLLMLVGLVVNMKRYQYLHQNDWIIDGEMLKMRFGRRFGSHTVSIRDVADCRSATHMVRLLV